MMWQDVLPSLVTAIIGAVSAVWAYWAGRKKRHIEHVKDTSAAIRELNETITLQADRNGDLVNKVMSLQEEIASLKSALMDTTLKLKEKDAKLDEVLRNQETLLSQLNYYRKAAPHIKPPRG